MRKSDLVELNHWFQNHQRVLPWRDEITFYRIWISEVMLQQTQVITVIPYFKKFIERFPGLESLAESNVDEVMYYWAGLGYYSRARNIHKSAQILIQQPQIPSSYEELIKLPGIGRYTAGAILSIAFNQAVPILDGNIKRVLSRTEKRKSPYKNEKKMWEISECYLRKAVESGIQPRDFNQAMMELGALLCQSQSARCQACPINNGCKADNDNCVTEFPAPKQRKKWKKIFETRVCLINPQNELLVVKTKEGEWRQGLWDFPENDLFKTNSQTVKTIHSNHVP